jgi:translation initiation factor IF-2
VNNKSIKNASPSQPVRIVGLKSLPKAGDPIVCVQSEEMANEIISRREVLAAKESHRAETSGAPLDLQISGTAAKKGFMTQNVLKRYGLGDNIESEEEGKSKDEEKNEDEIRIPVILKADADGTLAALRDTLLAIQDESKLNLCIDPIALSIGHITPSDVNMAAESGAGIFCFNLKGAKDKTAMSLAATEGVDIRSNDVIYHLLNEAKELFSTYCPPTSVEKIHGKATIKAVFDINNNRNSEKVAGLMVENGTFYLDKSSKDSGSLDCHYRVIRGNEVISPETLSARSLRREKEEVKSVRFGEECGLNLLDFVDIQEGDKIECFSTVSKRIFV